jgi:hypothetical protein
MVAGIAVHDWRERKVREWLLLLLRFAVSLNQRDRLAVEAMADELDSVGELRWRPTAPSFFRRTTTQVCDAVLANGGDAASVAILRRHIARIEDARLRRAFRAAVDLASSATRGGRTRDWRRERQNLWTGLSAK